MLQKRKVKEKDLTQPRENIKVNYKTKENDVKERQNKFFVIIFIFEKQASSLLSCVMKINIQIEERIMKSNAMEQ